FRLGIDNDSDRNLILAMTTNAYCLLALGLIGPVLTAASQSLLPVSIPVAASPLSPTEQTIKEIKNPTPWLSWGGDFRVRNEYFNNTLTLNPDNSLAEQDYFRFRAR